VLSKYIKMEKVSGLKHNGFWYDVGDIEKLKIVEKLFI
jgi:NDP-sugar pyrophosphorylase family protein